MPFTFNEPNPPTLVRITDTTHIQEFVSADSIGRPSGATRGVVIGALGQPWVHACEGYTEGDVRQTPAEFLEDLQTLGGLTTDPVTSTVFDGHSALTTGFRVGASRCTPDFHVTYDDTHGSNLIPVDVASQLTVLELAGTTIVLDVWAQTDDQLQAWLPTASALVDSIHFLNSPAATHPPSSVNDFLGYLHGYAQDFAPGVAPTNAVDWHSAVDGYPFAGALVESIQYGTVTCVDPAQGFRGTCALAPADEPTAIWLVTFEDAPEAQGCPMWATVDPRTGAFINGTSAPCR